jgi:hypothetical protein
LSNPSSYSSNGDSYKRQAAQEQANPFLVNQSSDPVIIRQKFESGIRKSNLRNLELEYNIYFQKF